MNPKNICISNITKWASEMFGKKALMEIIRNNHTASARQIVDTATETLAQFRGDEAPEDDITLVVIKVDR